MKSGNILNFQCLKCTRIRRENRNQFWLANGIWNAKKYQFLFYHYWKMKIMVRRKKWNFKTIAKHTVGSVSAMRTKPGCVAEASCLWCHSLMWKIMQIKDILREDVLSNCSFFDQNSRLLLLKQNCDWEQN